jgi:hypothetical protein
MSTNKSCDEFIDQIRNSWDSIHPWAMTAVAASLSDTDADALREICDKNDDNYYETNYQVIKIIIDHYNKYVQTLYKKKGI